ncbi:MAG: hypothetical protein PHV15_10110 [Thomasclavelia ramosa]|nr:hypothetical protein [Thomasclavelia ramosa]
MAKSKYKADDDVSVSSSVDSKQIYIATDNADNEVDSVENTKPKAQIRKELTDRFEREKQKLIEENKKSLEFLEKKNKQEIEKLNSNSDKQINSLQEKLLKLEEKYKEKEEELNNVVNQTITHEPKFKRDDEVYLKSDLNYNTWRIQKLYGHSLTGDPIYIIQEKNYNNPLIFDIILMNEESLSPKKF